jgi:nucleotide-binding universal stress UspA family protein
MFTTIIARIDLLDRHQRAVDLAARLGEPAGGTVALLHVIEPIPWRAVVVFGRRTPTI